MLNTMVLYALKLAANKILSRQKEIHEKSRSIHSSWFIENDHV